MSSLKRMLAIFDELAERGVTLPAEDIISRLGYSRGTGYRYLKVLADAGFLYRSPHGFGLGPRITELDYILRQHDPISQAARPVLDSLSQATEAHALLARFFDAKVIVSEQAVGSEAISVSYDRGRRMPLFRGAPSKVLLAALPQARRKRLYDAHATEIAACGMGDSWPAFRSQLNDIARARACVSIGELDHGNVGLAAPVASGNAAQPLALTLVMTERRFSIIDQTKVTEALLRAASRLGTALAGER